MKTLEIEGKIRIPNNKYADDNEVYSYKGRVIDLEKPIFVYRNLNKKGKWYSIKQDGLIVAHSTALCIRDVEFIVNQKARERVVKSRKREPHAFIKGFYTTSGMGTSARKNDLPAKIEYNPFKDKSFTCKNLTIQTLHPKGAWFCICNSEGVRASYLD